ncbi:MAG: sn-glycerol-3-phosphate ABC transporter ATP-binding protein UgpC [Tahibacter sp.]
MAEVRLDAVRKVYDNGHVGVDSATFDIADGEFVVLVGPSGCGKSTLLRMIAGLESISSGTLAIGGRIVNDVAPKDRDIAMVFQSYALYPHMSVRQNLAFGLTLRGTSRDETDRRVNEAAETLELTALLARKPGQLSGGQRQRVALGRALVRNPSVFLLDEPLSNLDARLRMTMRVEIAKLHRKLGTTMVYVTHDQIEAMTLGQRIVVLKDGAIQQIDTPMNLYARPANLFVAGFLGSPAMNLMRGRVVERGGLQLDVGNALLPLNAISTDETAAPGVSVGDDLTAGLRPEDLIPVDGIATGALLKAQLELVEPVGNEVFLNLRSGAHILVARVPPRILPEVGTSLELRFDPARLHLFDSATGNRIA